MTCGSTTIDDEIVSLVGRCVGFDPTAATGADLDAHAALLARVASWVDAQRARVGAARRRLEDAAAEASSRARGAGSPPPRRRARPMPGPGSGSGAQTRRDHDTAEGARRCPSFADALAEGHVSADHLAALGRVRNGREATEAEADLLAAAVARSADEFAAWSRAWDDARDTARGADLAQRRRIKRRVSFHVDDDGMPVTRAVLGPTDHAKVTQALHDTADALWRAGDRTSTLPQRLADALVALITGEADRATVEPTDHAPHDTPHDDMAPDGTPADDERHDEPSSPSAPPATTLRRPSAPTILAILDHAWMRTEADRVGLATTLDGVPLTPTELRIALCEANVLPVVLGGDGHILDFGRTRRHATDAQWRALLARDGGCVIAGCPAPTHWTVAHHCRPWEHHGPTDLANLCLLCPTHHRTLHLQGWTAALDGGVVHITTTAGHEVPTRTRTGPVPARGPTGTTQLAA